MQRMRCKHILLTGFLSIVLLVGCTASVAPQKNVTLPGYPSPTPTIAAPQPATIINISPAPLNEYLTNPGIGWQSDADPFSITDFPETVSYSNRQQIAWAKLNPADGVYDWSALDEQLNQSILDGKQFSFRIYTYTGELYGRTMIPGWVLDEGGVLLGSGEPDYSSCAYQETWGKFVTELALHYDGNPNIAFIDISGYGNFNEWSWQDRQTKWDEQWAVDYNNGSPSAKSFQTLDGQARRRLADMFIGGSFNGHLCRTASGETAVVNYAYPGFQKTQLLMPYAGIIQSSQYVYFRRHDVGFRYDCLGRDGQALLEKMGAEIDQIWRHAPIVYEFCGPDQTDMNDIRSLLATSHPSLIHNNQWKYSQDQLKDLMLNVGYRYFLRTADLVIDDHIVDLRMEWQNLGSAPNYPKMGQNFSLYFYLLDSSGRPVFKDLLPVDISRWLPAAGLQQEAPGYWVMHRTALPASLVKGTYQIGVAIRDARTDAPINLSFDGRNENGIYIISPININ